MKPREQVADDIYFLATFDVLFDIPNVATTERIVEEGLETFLPSWWNRETGELNLPLFYSDVSRVQAFSHLHPDTVIAYSKEDCERDPYPFKELVHRVSRDHPHDQKPNSLYRAFNYVALLNYQTLPIDITLPSAYLVSMARATKIAGIETLERDYDKRLKEASGSKAGLKYEDIIQREFFQKVRDLTQRKALSQEDSNMFFNHRVLEQVMKAWPRAK